MLNFPHHGACFPSVLKTTENFLMSSLPAILPQYDRALPWRSQTLLVFLVTLSLSWRKFLGINWLDLTVHFVCCWSFCNKIVTPQQGKNPSIVHTRNSLGMEIMNSCLVHQVSEQFLPRCLVARLSVSYILD